MEKVGAEDMDRRNLLKLGAAAAGWWAARGVGQTVGAGLEAGTLEAWTPGTLNRLMNHQFIGQVKSQEGHVIVRVAPGGETFRVIVTESGDDGDRVKLVAGPFRCGERA